MCVCIQVVLNIKVGTCFFSSLSHLAKDTHTPFYVISDEQKEERESGGQTRIHTVTDDGARGGFGITVNRPTLLQD